jgi:hypothetical protein
MCRQILDTKKTDNKEKELLLNTVVSKHDLRREIEDQYDDEKEYGEGYLENILNDKLILQQPLQSTLPFGLAYHPLVSPLRINITNTPP